MKRNRQRTPKHLNNANPHELLITLLVVAMMGIGIGCSRAPDAQIVERSKDAQVIGVCEVLKHVGSYRGKMVAVRGIYWGELRSTCPEPLSAGGRAWPSALNLVDSDFAAQIETPVRFKTDRESWDTLDRLVIRAGKAGRREEIWATMAGELRAIQIFKDGRVIGGYGHLGAFAVELVVHRVFDVEIKANPTYDYSKMLRARPY